ncbi:MAG: protein-L-isoaspartate O-methyltransferase [Candidatus Aminicenantes bacterium RBG_13_59_9]|jgi:protein-L-isoaspartate(D-aspartate) O-methyltransferase|nr:MAG: protein-L-isoaspartate O-methyltransferase [Candidatus Aminicenantes bacterium RBG_13_59_9]
MQVCLPLVLVVYLASFISPIFSEAGQETDAYARKRQKMVKEQLAARDISDRRVLEAMGRVPRHLFVPPAYRDEAYADYPLPIGESQTISQPYIVALMTQCLALKGGEKILEIGTGSGYQAAVLAELKARVFSIDINPGLAEQAGRTLRELGYEDIRVKSGDGFFGWPEEAPFDAIIITCASPRLPPLLVDELREGGRLIIPLGGARQFQVLTLVTKTADGIRTKEISGVRFVPMTGEAQKKQGR